MRCIQKIHKEQGGFHHNGSAMLAFSGLVSSAAGNSGGLSTTSALSQGLIKRPTQSGESTSGSRKLSHWQNIRDNMLMAKEVSEIAAELLLVGQHKGTNTGQHKGTNTGWHKGTNTAHQSGWARWSQWYNEQEVDPVSCWQPTISRLSEDLHGEGLQYRSINLVRSVVSMTHNTIKVALIGQHTLVSRMMRGL